MQIVLIDKEERDRLLEEGYEPLYERSNEVLGKEWRQVYDAVRRRVEARWVHGVDPGTDFYMDLDWDRSRLLAIEVCNEEMLEPWLFDTIQEVLVGYEERFAVDVCDSWGYLKDRDGHDYPHFNMFVERDKILAYAESPVVLDKIGFR